MGTPADRPRQLARCTMLAGQEAGRRASRQEGRQAGRLVGSRTGRHSQTHVQVPTHTRRQATKQWPLVKQWKGDADGLRSNIHFPSCARCLGSHRYGGPEASWSKTTGGSKVLASHSSATTVVKLGMKGRRGAGRQLVTGKSGGIEILVIHPIDFHLIPV